MLPAAMGEIERQAKEINRMQAENEDLTECFDCGKKLSEIEPGEQYILGSLYLDPGDPGDRYTPPEPGCVYFACKDCVTATDKQAKRIAELEADKKFWQDRSQTLRVCCNAAELQNNRQRAALKILGQRSGKRGKALVKEVAARIAYENNMQLCECREYAMCQARQQLRAEGLL